jgi:NADPH-dependent curcumin reductase CurA
MNNGGCIACCGAISDYDVASLPAGPRHVPSVIVFKRLTMKGFILTDIYAERDKAIAELASWLKAGTAHRPTAGTECSWRGSRSQWGSAQCRAYVA